MKMASVFSGIGGEMVAASMMGWDVEFFCERNPFGNKVLSYWYPNAKNYDDITTTDFTQWRGRIDVLTGGFPCQPFSYAGKRKGAEDDRYLWPFMFRCIDQIRPTWVVAENVAGIRTMVEQGKVSRMEGQADILPEDNGVPRYQFRGTFTLERICKDLEEHGYSVQPILIPACAVGAPHRRDRVFIVARRIEAVSENTMRGGFFRGQHEEQGSERNERHTCAESSERVCGETSRTTSPDPSCGREGASRQSSGPTCDGCNENQQSGEWGAETERPNGCAPLLRNTPYARNNGQQGSHIGTSRQETIGRGSDGFMFEPTSANGCGGVATDTESECGERLRPQQSEARGAQQGQFRRRGCEDGSGRISADTVGGRIQGCSDNGEQCDQRTIGQRVEDSQQIGSRHQQGWQPEWCEAYYNVGQRWQNFPSVSPVHRGNDGLPFSLDDLTISAGKWRTEALKAYGNAIVPQVMYEIFRAIEIVEMS